MEKDDEVKGDGNSYTTHFRQLDPRLGRWLSYDPKATAWESPYASMGNNSIKFNDVLGDTWDPKNDSQSKADGFRKEANERLTEIGNKLTSISEELSGITDQTSDRYKVLITEQTNLNDRKSEIETSLIELDVLEHSNQVYRLEDRTRNPNSGYSSRAAGEGRTYYKDYRNKKKTDVVVVQYWRENGGINYNTMAHELKHAYQFEIGEISFEGVYGDGGDLYDLTDEQDAWHRGSAFDDDNTTPLLNLSTIELTNQYQYNNNIPTVDLKSSTSWGAVYAAHSNGASPGTHPDYSLSYKDFNIKHPPTIPDHYR
jgi:hypothetical protein